MDKISTHGSMIEQLDLTSVPRSGFDMAFHNYLTGRLGALIPTAVKEILPGDRIKGSNHIVTQFEPLAAPIMANMIQKDETFFVPFSVIWDKAHRFFTGKKGFDDDMPSYSISSIISSLNQEYGNFVFPYDLFLTAVGFNNLDIPKLKQLVTGYDNNSFIAANGLQDLYKPLMARMLSAYNRLISLTGTGTHITSEMPFWDDLTDTQTNDIASAVADILYSVYDFYFGPSSMCDYLGVGYFDFRSTFTKWVHELIFEDFEDIHSDTFDGVLNDYIEVNYGQTFNWLPFRACYWIWYWNYRDQLIETDAIDPEEEMFSSTISSLELLSCIILRQRCWFKDTYTTALTNTGQLNIVVPDNEVSVQYRTIHSQNINLDNTLDSSSIDDSLRDVVQIKVGDISYRVPSQYLNSDSFPGSIHTNTGLSLNLLERAKRLSSWISKRLVLGTEYDDVVYSSFMVKLSNVRMHIPELLGVGRSDVAINVVVNNTTTQEQIAGSKTAVAYSNNIQDLSGINYYAEEHGLLISYMSIMPIQSYPAQVQRLYMKRNRFDFAWPEFAQLGMDAIYLSELNGAIALNTDTKFTVFGYQGRYYDYKCNQDEEHGRMHTDLNYLTFGRVWSPDSLPKLNPEFIHCWCRTDMFVIDDGFSDVFRADVHHRWAMERCLPVPSDVLR